uniref:Pentacotripeptide-repeat region of PRORP domain-containing protein n=1 Tax=Salix viminalis TaxID=40686 RepID=A0A6N2M6B2_SALVM
MEGNGVYADMVTYNTLIGAYCREGLLEEAFQIMNSMAEKGLKPSLSTYNARAEGILIELLNIGLSPDTTTYNTLLVEGCRRDNLSEADEFLNMHRRRS